MKDVYDEYRYMHPLVTKDYISNIDRQQIRQLANEVSSAIETLKRLNDNQYMQSLIRNPATVKYLDDIVKGKRPRPSNVPELPFLIYKGCISHADEVKKDDALRQDCNMLMLAAELADRATNDLWFIKQNISVPIGAPAADKQGKRLSDQELIERDKRLFPSEMEEIESFRWDSI